MARQARTQRAGAVYANPLIVDGCGGALCPVANQAARVQVRGDGPARSGSADIGPSLFGVSPFRHCHGPRADPTWGPWPSGSRSTAHATRSAASSTRSSARTWRRFSVQRPIAPTAPGCRSSWSSPASPCGSGSSACPIGCAISSRGITTSAAPCSASTSGCSWTSTAAWLADAASPMATLYREGGCIEGGEAHDGEAPFILPTLLIHAFADDSITEEVVACGIAVFHQARVDEAKKLLIGVKQSFGIPADEPLHCRVMFSGDARRGTCWEALGAERIDKLVRDLCGMCQRL